MASLSKIMDGEPCCFCHRNNPSLVELCEWCKGVQLAHDTIERITIQHRGDERVATVTHEERVPLWVDESGSNKDQNGNEQDKWPMCMAVQIEVFGMKCLVVVSEDPGRGVRISAIRNLTHSEPKETVGNAQLFY
ncbi:hypothetical protein BCIN_06g03520 [Botrytis cinerea B05.10]|uniref:Uncharacterized protein n=3 Tax=Botryotinia fuckeliana TaxID=40559 RepID=A0A384JK78_BOTFB|nr:hypothetical protein BCIN_06g03520 [Botrytis cinerea B05.10]ATZ50882.1 hypothetical protein BCIN_06g03520 [Botrytis cinerea B05.10]EMR86351.1 hypothetical protein BcDW1_4915 [Botrytis cinerea BcDW1]